MAKTVSYANAFTAGEIGPDAWERSDLQQHAKGCAEAANMIGLVTGPLVSRGGFLDRGAAVFQASRSRLVSFVRSSEDALLLELGQNVMRVWTTAGDPVMDGGAPYQLATPWTADRAFRLWFEQLGDVLFVTDLDGGRTRVITRQADAAWTIAPFDFREGPWLPEEIDSGVTLTASSKTGITTLTTSAPRFTAQDVGALIQVRESDGSPGYQTWTSETEYSDGQLVQFDGRVYSRVPGGAKSGTTPPLHSEGTVSDGVVQWTFVHDGRGVAVIESVTSPNTAQAVVTRTLPTTAPTRFWSKQAYSAVEGYPRALPAEREERLVFAASPARPATVDLTRTAGFGPAYGDFRPGLGTGRVVDDDAVRLNVGGASRVVWLLSATCLVAGCTDGEYVLSGSQQDEPVTPLARRAAPVSTYGNADVEPLLIQGPPPTILHVLRSRTTIRETRIAPDLSVESRNLSILAHHIHGRGVAEQAWQQSENLVWLRLDDGGLAAMTFDMEQQVTGTTRQPLPPGWSVESLACVPAPDGADVLFASMVRNKAGQAQRRIWRLSARADNVFVDGARRYAGAPLTLLNVGADLEGDVVAIVAGGARVPDQVVAGGKVTLPEASGDVVVGFKMRRRFETLPLDMEGLGSTNARTLIPTHATVIVTGADFLVGTDQTLSAERVRSRSPDDQASPVVKRLRQRVALGNGAGRDARLVIETDAPFDLVLHAYRLEADTQP